MKGGKRESGIDRETDLQSGGVIDGHYPLVIHIGVGRVHVAVGRTRKGNTDDNDHATTTNMATELTATVGREMTTMETTTETNKLLSVVARYLPKPTHLP
jgi:hypothetical protein